MKKRIMALFLLPLLLAGCSNTEASSSADSAKKDSGEVNDGNKTIEKYLAKSEEFYKIDSDFNVKKDNVVMITGYDSKAVYIGQVYQQVRIAYDGNVCRKRVVAAKLKFLA